MKRLNKIIAVILIALFSLPCHADNPKIDISIIAEIESSNNPKAVSYKGAKYGRGLLQISEVALQDYNAANSSEVAPEQLYNPEVNLRVGKWYFGQIRRYLSHFSIKPTLEHILIAYNFGIGNLRKYLKGEVELPEETKQYIKKYKKGGGNE